MLFVVCDSVKEIISTESWALCIACLKENFSYSAHSSLPKASKRNGHSSRIPHNSLQHGFVSGLLLSSLWKNESQEGLAEF